MSDRNLILTLAKVLIAAAWADGEVSLEEINSLKFLLFQLPRVRHRQGFQVTGREWAQLEMYIASPVSAEERARLVHELKAALRTPKDRALALAALEDLVQADGVVTEEEQTVVAEIETALASVNLGVVARLARRVRRRPTQVSKPGREAQLEDFIRNKIFFVVRQRLNLDAESSNLPERAWRKLCLTSGVMALVAHTDQAVTADQVNLIADILRAGWDIPCESATIITEVAVSEIRADLDYFRLTHEFAACTTEDERVRFLDVLFAVAGADGQVSNEENDEIRRIALSLNLTRGQFADANTKALHQGRGKRPTRLVKWPTATLRDAMGRLSRRRTFLRPAPERPSAYCHLATRRGETRGCQRRRPIPVPPFRAALAF